MDLKNTKLSSRKRSALASDDDFRFQPEPEKSKRAHGSLSLVPSDATLVLSSSKEVRRSSRRGSHVSPSSGIQENGCNRSPHFVPARALRRGSLPQTPKDDVPSNICATSVDFVARHHLVSMLPKCLSLMSV